MKPKKHSLHILLIFLLGLCTGFILRNPDQKGIHLNAMQISATRPFNEGETLPIVAQLLHRQGYSVCYDGRTRLPYYVIETISKDSVTGDADRGVCSFKEDETIPAHLRSRLGDYVYSGFDRGHLSPAAHHRSNQDAMRESFLLTNIAPQVAAFNRGFMLKVERHIRSLLETSNAITIITGPIFQPEKHEGGKSYVSYQVLGEGYTAVPHAFYKIVRTDTGEYCYILPNRAIPPDEKIETFETNLEKIEAVTGILFR